MDDASKFNNNVLTDLINLGRDLKFSVLVTHIECEKQFKYVIENNIDKIQGKYIYKRIAINDVEDFMKHYGEHRANIDNIIKISK
ncbi:hypothetical protein D3C73_1486510 [compost metagenome]